MYIYIIVIVLTERTVHCKAGKGEIIELKLMMREIYRIYMTVSYTEFVEVPTNVTVPEGSEEGATFRCSHMSAAFVNWRIDGLPVDNLNHPNVPIPTLSIENGVRVSTLMVPATLRYDGSLVVCVASTVNGIEETPSATLTVIAGLL